MVQPPEIPCPPPCPPRGLPTGTPADRDAEHIRILSVCYYVQAGLTALFACFPIVHLVVGSLMLGGGLDGPQVSAHDRETMRVVGGMFVGVAILLILGGWTMAVLNVVVGKRIVRRESRVLCMVVAGLNCLSMPLGTALGVFTFVVLARPEVARSFERGG